MLLDFVNKCHSTLISKSNSEIKGAYDYLDGRGWITKTITENIVGYCLIDQKIPEEVRFFGNFNNEELERHDYSYFIRGRIIVPVFSEFGLCVGFATRKPSSEPGNTWWNLPKPFYKGNHLFLLNKTRKHIFDKNKIYLVEGYSDALMLYQEGLYNVCGLMGTTLTTRKIGLIARYCNNICLCLDVDKNESGQKAQDKAIHILREFGFCESISVIDGLQVGEDPDVYVRKHGINKLKEIEHKLTDEEVKDICSKVIQESKGVD